MAILANKDKDECKTCEYQTLEEVESETDTSAREVENAGHYQHIVHKASWNTCNSDFSLDGTFGRRIMKSRKTSNFKMMSVLRKDKQLYYYMGHIHLQNDTMASLTSLSSLSAERSFLIPPICRL